MGKRSRKRGADGAGPTVVAPGVAERRAEARRATAAARGGESERKSRRASLDELPKPPWAPFPLVELCVLLGLVMLGLGIFAGGDKRGPLITAGVGLACVAGVEQATREHFAAFRSHSALLSGVSAFVTVALISVIGVPYQAALPIAVAAFGVAFFFLRRAFLKRSGIGFRV